MTPARRKALQWFHDRGEVRDLWERTDRPSPQIIRMMLGDRQLTWTERQGHFLTDKGRRMLHGDDK